MKLFGVDAFFFAGTGPMSVTFFFAVRGRRFLSPLVGLMSSRWPAPVTEIGRRDGRNLFASFVILPLTSESYILDTVHGCTWSTLGRSDFTFNPGMQMQLTFSML